MLTSSRCSALQPHGRPRIRPIEAQRQPVAPPEMDAYVLLRHVRDKISLPKVAQQWPFPPPAKKSRAVQLRWHNVLKGLAGIDELSLLMCGRCEEQEMSETQLNSTEVSLQPWVEDALVNLHARKNVPMNSNFTPVDDRGGPPPVALVPERREDQRDPSRCPQLQVHRMPATPPSERHATGSRRAPQEPLRP